MELDAERSRLKKVVTFKCAHQLYGPLAFIVNEKTEMS